MTYIAVSVVRVGGLTSALRREKVAGRSHQLGMFVSIRKEWAYIFLTWHIHSPPACEVALCIY